MRNLFLIKININRAGIFPLTCRRVGFMVYVVLCQGAPEGSTGRGSGSKNILEDGATA